MKKVTIKEVAELANVSKSTVSQYLNNRFDYMGVETKKKIESVIEELSYQPNIVARSLRQKSTTTIGVIVANILHEFSTQIIRAIEDQCNEYGYHIIVCNADDNSNKEKEYINTLIAKQVDGIISLPTGKNTKLYEEMNQSGFPIVFLDRRVQDLPINSILLDNEAASQLAVKEFSRNGYKKISAFFTYPSEDVTPRQERLKGLKKALKKYNLKEDPDFIHVLQVEDVQPELTKIFTSSNRPEAILAMNDRILVEILKFLKKSSLKIPEDVGIIGIDDVSFAKFYSPSITTIAQPTFEMGRAAAKLLIKNILGEEISVSEGEQRFEPKLVVRESCEKLKDIDIL